MRVIIEKRKERTSSDTIRLIRESAKPEGETELIETVIVAWTPMCRALSRSSTVENCGYLPEDVLGVLLKKLWKCICCWPDGEDSSFDAYTKQALRNTVKWLATHAHTRQSAFQHGVSSIDAKRVGVHTKIRQEFSSVPV